MKIGLLGGTFNPAHDGHLHISQQAIKQLGLKQVWWLVTPGNPLKSSSDKLNFSSRFKSAELVAGRNPQIKLSKIEHERGLQFSIDIVKYLKKKHRGIKFYWLIGADNLVNFHRWHKWHEIIRLVELTVFGREGYMIAANNSPAMQKYRGKIKIYRGRKINISSTALRKQAKEIKAK